MKQQGFTFLEILMVLAILAIISMLFIMPLRRNINDKRVQEAAQGLANQIQQLKNTAVRTSQTTSITWSNDNPSTYQINLSGNAVSYTLPNNMKVSCIVVGSVPCPTNNTLQYFAPAGESSTGLVLKVEPNQGTNSQPTFIKVIGLAGKVVVSASSN